MVNFSTFLTYFKCLAFPFWNAVRTDWSSSEYLPEPEVTLFSKSSKSQYISKLLAIDGIACETRRVCSLNGARTFASWAKETTSVFESWRHLTCGCCKSRCTRLPAQGT